MYRVEFKRAVNAPTHPGRPRNTTFDKPVQSSYDNNQPYEAIFLDRDAAQAVLTKIRNAANYLNLGIDSSIKKNTDGTVTLVWLARDRRWHKRMKP